MPQHTVTMTVEEYSEIEKKIEEADRLEEENHTYDEAVRLWEGYAEKVRAKLGAPTWCEKDVLPAIDTLLADARDGRVRRNLAEIDKENGLKAQIAVLQKANAALVDDRNAFRKRVLVAEAAQKDAETNLAGRVSERTLRAEVERNDRLCREIERLRLEATDSLVIIQNLRSANESLTVKREKLCEEFRDYRAKSEIYSTAAKYEWAVRERDEKIRELEAGIQTMRDANTSLRKSLAKEEECSEELRRDLDLLVVASVLSKEPFELPEAK